MQFPPHIYDLIRDYAKLSQVIGKTISLKPKGREFLGLCPFHHEKTPSFTVNDDKKFYHCFGCGEHGDVIKFTSYITGLSFVQTIKHLAQEYNIELPSLGSGNNDNNQYDKHYALLEEVCSWFEAQLKLAKNQNFLKYLLERGLSKEVISTFRLGCVANDANSLKHYLLNKNYSIDLLLEAGLIIKSKQNQDYYDRFRNRIMFPISNYKGQVIAFGGRTLADIQPKYLNSPETILFKKSHNLYGEHLAKSSIITKKNLLVVEGYMDVIAMHSAGFTETVACLGTAINENHIDNLWRLNAEPHLCLDGDSAGIRASYKLALGCLTKLKIGYSFKFIKLPNKLDPDEFIKINGNMAMIDLIKNASNLSNYIWDFEYSELPNNPSPDQIAVIEKKLMDLTDQITNPSLKNNYRKFFSQKLWENVKKSAKLFTAQKKEDISRLSGLADLSYLERIEHTLIALILNYPHMLDNHAIEEEFTLCEFSDYKLDELRTTILEIYHNEKHDLNNITDLIDRNQHISNISYYANIGLTYIIKEVNNHNPEILWSHSLNKHRLMIIEDEYKFLLNQLTEETMNKAYELKKQLTKIQQDIEKIEKIFDD